MYKVLLLAHSTFMGHATPTGPWNQVKSSTEMGVQCKLCCSVLYVRILYAVLMRPRRPKS